MLDLTLMQFLLNDRKFRQSLVGIDNLNAVCAVDLTVESSRGRFIRITDRFSDLETPTTRTKPQASILLETKDGRKKEASNVVWNFIKFYSRKLQLQLEENTNNENVGIRTCLYSKPIFQQQTRLFFFLSQLRLFLQCTLIVDQFSFLIKRCECCMVVKCMVVPKVSGHAPFFFNSVEYNTEWG